MQVDDYKMGEPAVTGKEPREDVGSLECLYSRIHYLV